ncbi:methylmalonyl-CoA mutase [Mesorhizobium sp. NBSH29]|uniref:methylmalonyl-CoA mutase family protein n=1 Tax=Mesorhizobium sp. NBSH29 TaxID=2654249 RepID=UPI0018967F07|nr:methylmalonyl-CoA mutase family protein [Mesorhizobium sp. NBSH29]QPC88654.1 methylmalonyl-CoA mutase [Mesorhizobium sp. NBSH29]
MDAGAVFKDTVFPAFDRGRWEALAGSGFAAAVAATDDGIAIDPLAERRLDGQPILRSNPTLQSAITQRIDDPDPVRANAQAREDVANGANGLALVFEGAPGAFGYGLPATSEALATALDGIALDTIYLRIDAHPQSRVSIDWLVALLTQRKVDPTKLNVAFGVDPASALAGSGRLRMSIEALQASMPQSLAHFFGLDVPGVLLEADGRVFHNAGATEAQELGIMLASSVSHLRMFEEARQPLIFATPHIGFALSVDQDQFLAMAKIRAMRKLWVRAQEACSIPPSPAIIHAETSYRMMTRLDAETNILRGTIAAFAAATAGADSISVLPYTIAHGLPDGFARRVARNTQLVMRYESRVDFVSDPVAGAGSVEALTDALCEGAWAEFQRIEQEGGVLKALAGGMLQARIVEARDKRAEDYRSGKRALVGTTLYPQKTERPLATLEAGRATPSMDGTAVCEPLVAMRIDQSIEGRS